MNDVENLVDATYMDNTLWQLAVAAGVARGRVSGPAADPARGPLALQEAGRHAGNRVPGAAVQGRQPHDGP